MSGQCLYTKVVVKLKYENKKILSAPLVNTTFTVVRLILYKRTRNSELTFFFISQVYCPINVGKKVGLDWFLVYCNFLAGTTSMSFFVCFLIV